MANNMQQVLLARPYRYGAMGSLGDASLMLIRQHNFPLYYQRGVDVMTSADDDRIRSWHGSDHYSACRKRYFGNEWFENAVTKAFPDKVINFIIDAMKLRNHVENGHIVAWTGFRILGSVNRGNGYPVFSMQLFSNVSGTEVYSGPVAPNVDMRVGARGEDYYV